MPISPDLVKFFGPRKPTIAEIDKFISSVLCSPLSSYGDTMFEADRQLGLDLDPKVIKKFSKSILIANDPLIFSVPDIRTSGGFVEDWWNAINFLRKQLEKIGCYGCSGNGFSLNCDSITVVEPTKYRAPTKLLSQRRIDFGKFFSLTGQKPEIIMNKLDALPSTSLIYWLAFNPRICSELGQGALPGLIVPGVIIDDDNNLAPLITCRGKEVIISSIRIDRKSNDTLPVYAD